VRSISALAAIFLLGRALRYSGRGLIGSPLDGKNLGGRKWVDVETLFQRQVPIRQGFGSK
jgi:hypothetical protein